MEQFNELVSWLFKNKEELIAGYLAFVGFASVVVRLTPTLADDNFFLPIIKFTAKYIALDKKVNDEERPK